MQASGLVWSWWMVSLSGQKTCQEISLYLQQFYMNFGYTLMVSSLWYRKMKNDNSNGNMRELHRKWHFLIKTNTLNKEIKKISHKYKYECSSWSEICSNTVLFPFHWWEKTETEHKIWRKKIISRRSPFGQLENGTWNLVFGNMEKLV